jgi:hypothetical protein
MKKIVLILLSVLILFPASLKSQTEIVYAQPGQPVFLEIGWTGENHGAIQWQESIDEGETWSDINGATFPTYTFTTRKSETWFRAEISIDNCDPVYVTRQVKAFNFDVALTYIDYSSAEFLISNFAPNGAEIEEYGFCYALSTMNTLDYREMQQVKLTDPLPSGNPFSLICPNLLPGTSYNIRLYFKTTDGSTLYGPVKTAKTMSGIKWTSEDWIITPTSISVRFEMVRNTSTESLPTMTFLFGSDSENLQAGTCTHIGSGKYASRTLTGLTPNTNYIAQIEAWVSGEKQVLIKQVKTLPDYSSVIVDQTTTPAKHILLWDTQKTLHPISPVDMQTEYPRIVRVDEKKLLCVYHAGNYSDYWKNIYLQKSYDNGMTWAEPVCLMDKDRSQLGENYWRFCNPELCKLRNGWILMSFIGNGNPETNENCQVMVMCSKDGGDTWSPPVIVGRGRTWEPMIVQLPNDELELFVSSEAQWYQQVSPMPQEILFSRSTDNGENWTEWKRACYSPDRRDGMPVATVMQGNKGILFAIEVVNDGGWGSPSLVKRPLDGEWETTPWNNADTDRRWHITLSTHGGAPYLIQLPSGEMVVSAHINGRNGNWQTSYPQIAIGDNNGKNFVTQTPISNLPNNEGLYYNSLFLKDDQTVWLVMTHAYFDGSTRIKGEIVYLEGKIVEK